MKIVVKAELRRVRGGVEARSPEVSLTSHGLDEREAVESLRRGVLAWCAGLRTMQRLERAVRDRNLKCEEVGEELSIDVRSEWLAKELSPTEPC